MSCYATRIRTTAPGSAEDAGDSRVKLNDPVGVKFNGGAAHLFDDRERGHHAVQDAGA